MMCKAVLTTKSGTTYTCRSEKNHDHPKHAFEIDDQESSVKYM